MSRYLVLTQEKIIQFQKEGRGLGEKEFYKPWIQGKDFRSLGRCHRILGILTGRVHYFFSDIEADFFFILEWNSNVLDIREQFPLPTIETEQIAAKLGVAHPKCKDGSSYVMTTDFLITYQDPISRKIKYIARSVKPLSGLSEKRTLQKLQIEQQYWKSQDINWKCVTENSFSRQKAKNIRKVLALYNKFEMDERTEIIALALMKRILVSENQQLQNVCDQINIENSLEQGEALSLFYYLVANRYIVVDFERKIWTAILVKELIDLDILKNMLSMWGKEQGNEA